MALGAGAADSDGFSYAKAALPPWILERPLTLPGHQLPGETTLTGASTSAGVGVNLTTSWSSPWTGNNSKRGRGCANRDREGCSWQLARWKDVRMLALGMKEVCWIQALLSQLDPGSTSEIPEYFWG